MSKRESAGKKQRPAKPRSISSLIAQLEAFRRVQIRIITEQSLLKSEIDLLWQVLIDNRLVAKADVDRATVRLAEINEAIRKAAGESPDEAVEAFLRDFEGPKQ